MKTKFEFIFQLWEKNERVKKTDVFVKNDIDTIQKVDIIPEVIIITS